MKKVRPWCGQPSDRGWLRNRTEHCSDCSRFVQAVSDSIHSPTRRNSPVSSRRRRRYKLSNKLELKMFYQTQTARRPPKGPKSVVFCPSCALPSPQAATGWSCLLLLDVICSERVTMHCQWGYPPKTPFYVRGDLDF